MEAFWIILGFIGLCWPQTRIMTGALLLMGALQTSAYEDLSPGLAEGFGVSIEFMTACMCVLLTPTDRPLWSTTVVRLFALSLSTQALCLFLRGFGVPVDWPLYLATTAIYSAQLLCLAYPGGRALALSVRSCGLRRRKRDGDALRVSVILPAAYPG